MELNKVNIENDHVMDDNIVSSIKKIEEQAAVLEKEIKLARSLENKNIQY